MSVLFFFYHCAPKIFEKTLYDIEIGKTYSVADLFVKISALAILDIKLGGALNSSSLVKVKLYTEN